MKITIANKKPWLIILLLSLALLAGCVPSGFQDLANGLQGNQKSLPTEIPPAFQDEKIRELESALRDEINQREDVLVFTMYEMVINQVTFSEAEDLALVWLAMRDADSQLVIASEPFLALARRLPQADENNPAWDFIFPTDPEWNSTLETIPDDLMEEKMRKRYRSKTQALQHSLVFRGYRLPWQAGLTKYLTGSIGHVFTYKSCPDSCLHAYDFADGSMFPIHAARAGRVKLAVWKWPNGDSKNSNFLVLEDTTTNPVTYQLYLHLAQDSIPPELRQIGAQVYQGQFIALADDTGYSTGHHLHFHVHTNSSSYWGTSVDIAFDEVDINGGRPRTCQESRQFPNYGSQCNPRNQYTSNNQDTQPPTTGITYPVNGQTISTSSITVQGWAQDDNEVLYSQLLIHRGEDWEPVGKLQVGNSFEKEIDLCELEVPKGYFFLAVQAIDQAGNLTQGFDSTIHLVKDFHCGVTPPDCTPSDIQAAIFEKPNFEGYCELLDIGEYDFPKDDSIYSLDQIHSLKLGKEAAVILSKNGDTPGQYEIFVHSEIDLTLHPLGMNHSTAIQVLPRLPEPDPPTLQPPGGSPGFPPTEEDPITLVWNEGGATEFRSEITGANGYVKSLDWQQDTEWIIGELPADEYSWTVWNRNLFGENSAAIRFVVEAPRNRFETKLNTLDEVYFTTAIQLEWEVLQGEDLIHQFEIHYHQDDQDWQIWDKPLPGHTRSAWFLGEGGSFYTFRLQTIDSYENLESFSPDHEQSTQIASECTPDPYDDITGNNNSIVSATLFFPDQAQEHNLCGIDDEDWFRIFLKSGIQYRFLAESTGKSTVVHLQLYNLTGNDLLAETRGENFGESTELVYTADGDEELLLKVSPMVPGLYGTDVGYRLSASSKRTIPVTLPPFLCGGVIAPLGVGIAQIIRQLRSKMQRK